MLRSRHITFDDLPNDVVWLILREVIRFRYERIGTSFAIETSQFRYDRECTYYIARVIASGKTVPQDPSLQVYLRSRLFCAKTWIVLMGTFDDLPNDIVWLILRDVIRYEYEHQRGAFMIETGICRYEKRYWNCTLSNMIRNVAYLNKRCLRIVRSKCTFQERTFALKHGSF
jgi:hypothetical protein